MIDTPLKDGPDRRMRTAEVLGRYFRDLQDEGFDEEFAKQLVAQAAEKLQHNMGLGVKADGR